MENNKVDYENVEFQGLRDAVTENNAIIFRISCQKDMLEIDITDKEKELIAEVAQYTKEINRNKFDLSYQEIEIATNKLQELYKKVEPIEERLLEMLDKAKQAK